MGGEEGRILLACISFAMSNKPVEKKLISYILQHVPTTPTHSPGYSRDSITSLKKNEKYHKSSIVWDKSKEKKYYL